ncbi:MAG: type II restriction endonuclease [Alphaproteobacteria bacterium]|nr:MAG: type II restriction endonuclease [Alphaproteobacteria bacterium]
MSSRGSLSDYFIGAGAKVLKGTEVDPKVSHGHELQGINAFRKFLGENTNKDVLPITYVWLSDDEPPISLPLTGTWYDSRRDDPKRSAEYRFYYPAEAESVVYRAKAGDTLFLCQPRQGPLLALFCAHGSTIEQQLLFLFGLHLEGGLIQQADLRKENDRSLDFISRYILDLIGVEVVETEDDLLEKLLRTFGATFPVTAAFSEFARANQPDVDGRKDPDGTLLAWVDFEERLFMTLEKHIVGKRLMDGFLSEGKPDVDAFIRFSLSVQNRRKSRAGFAFSNHIEALLRLHNVRFVREATTEKRNGPDFLFPGQAQYHDVNWPTAQLTMLGAKTSCKDRWRQVLAEADRITHKHILTLEPGISLAQTEEMRKEHLQLVLPTPLHASYQTAQQAQLMNVASFIDLVRSRQA